MNKKIEGYNLIRAYAILMVFFYHILNRQDPDGSILLALYIFGHPVMALLGFISAVLLSKKDWDFGSFLVKRFTRIYIPLVLCLGVVMVLQAGVGKIVINRHTLYHLLGLTAFFKFFGVQSTATIGYGLWFVTVIVGMYLLFPVLSTLFKHRNGFWHLLGIVLFCMGMDYRLGGVEQTFVVAMGFSVGVYFGANQHLEGLSTQKTRLFFLFPIGLFSLCALSVAGIIPKLIYTLFYALSPVAFVPVLLAFAARLPAQILRGIGFFAGISYEFYILHFYFINEGFYDFFRISVDLKSHILISFTITLVLSYILNRVATPLRKKVTIYLLGNNE
jgi:peptidoglycan/LPS O-acetylase OafA/YrhL